LELAKIQRTLKHTLSVIEEGGHTRDMTDRMRELEAREDVLKEFLAQGPADIPDIHPNVSSIYRKKVERLAEALNNPEDWKGSETRNSRSFSYGSVGIGGCGDLHPSQIALSGNRLDLRGED
jgi:hypothetical protein